MSGLTDEISALIDQATEEEKRTVLTYLRQQLPPHPLEEKWSTTAELILSAIARSPDLTQRGVRGIIAEAIFEANVLPKIKRARWASIAIIGNQSYDFLLQRDVTAIKVQVKMQRLEKGVPKQYASRSRATLRCPSETVYVVEVQKTRTGVAQGEETRPYRFGDFDLLAVNLHPSTGEWNRFVYTVGNWLLPRPGNPALIKIMQPLANCPDDNWADDLSTCIDWFLSGTQRRIYS